jgi:aldose 1-epimerase
MNVEQAPSYRPPSGPAPFGVGFHPYLTLGTASIDGLMLTVPATTRLEPTSPGGGQMLAPVEGTPQDFTRSRQIGSTQLDTAFGSLVRRDDGRAVALLHDPDSGRSLHLWVDDSYRYLMVDIPQTKCRSSSDAEPPWPSNQ